MFLRRLAIFFRVIDPPLVFKFFDPEAALVPELEEDDDDEEEEAAAAAAAAGAAAAAPEVSA